MLFKNVFRTLKKQYFQLLLLGVIILLSSFIYTVMEYSISGVLEPTEEYFVESNQEDFAISLLDIMLEDDVNHVVNNCNVITTLPPTEWPFTLSGLKNIDEDCYYNLLENRINIVESTYDDIDLEIRESKDVYFSNNNESYRIRFLKDMSVINKSYFVKGNAPDSESEIAVAETFAKNNNLDIGSSFTMNDKVYTISGFVLFPDYNLPMFGADFILDNATQTVGMLSDQEFENLEENVMFEVAGVFENDNSDELFEEEVIETYRDKDELQFVTNILLTENNTRSGAIYAELTGGRAYGVLLSLLISSIALMIVGIMVSRVLQSQRGPIGILKSMGYTNNQITYPYIFFIAIMALPIIVIGYYLGLVMSEPFKEVFMEFYLLPSREISQLPQVFLVAVVVPFGFIVGLSFFIVRRLLNKKPVDLLNPEVTSSSNFITKRVSKYLKKFKITSKLQHLLLYRNIVKFTVFLIGMFYAAFLILFSLSMNGIFDRMLYDYYDNTSHEYIAYCDYQKECEYDGNMETVIELPSVIADDEDTYLVGLSLDSSLHPLYNNKDEDITLDLKDGVIITQSFKVLHGLSIGDEIEIEIGIDKITKEVSGITYEYSGSKIYMAKDEVSDILSDDTSYYNAIYSDVELNKDDYLAVISISDIVKQADNMQGFFSITINLMVGSSVLIGAIIIYILTVMTIEDNFYNISLFKVIGFNDKEINKMILGGYSLYGVIIFIVSIPFAILSFYIMEIYMAQFYQILLPMKFVWWHAIVGVLIYLIIFYVGAFNAKRRLTKVSLQEAMKMYQI